MLLKPCCSINQNQKKTRTDKETLLNSGTVPISVTGIDFSRPPEKAEPFETTVTLNA